MVVSLKNVSMVSSKLLVTAKSVAADPSAPNARNQLAAAARWEHWLTSQTLEVICFLYCFVFTDETSRSSTSFTIFFLLSVTSLLIISRVYNCITHMPVIFILVHIHSYGWEPWQTCCCSSFSSFPTSRRTLAPTRYRTCYHNIHTSLHSGILSLISLFNRGKCISLTCPSAAIYPVRVLPSSHITPQQHFVTNVSV